MKKKRLENHAEVQKLLEENVTIEKKKFTELLKKAVDSSSEISA